MLIYLSKSKVTIPVKFINSRVCGLDCWIAINAITKQEITRAHSESGCRSQVLTILGKYEAIKIDNIYETL